ncbi:acyltransferase family protein [uncultured Xanthomonas sp.]|uniref:acyltransferase family protein n=1 Tax=uncultured Xanthomonas sp. TaxID=152831 RepID=UPI0025D1AF40|nr:acyltransferase family protein [uncultured Xanthomonas sp.]
MSAPATAVSASVPAQRRGARASAPRDMRIDAAKAIAILLVVFGHAKGIPHAYVILAYSFHVPMFFLLSGWVGEAFGNRPLTLATVGKLARSLLLPYVAFFFVAYAYWMLTRHIGSKAQLWGDRPWWEPLLGLVSGIGPKLYVMPALWFLPALFVTTLAYLALRRTLSLPVLAGLSLPLAWGWACWFPGQDMRLPFSLDVLPVALCFFAIGALAATRAQWWPARPAGNALAALLLGAAWFAIAWHNGRVDVNMLKFGDSPLGFLAASLLGSAMALCVAGLVRHWGWLQWIGRNTLLILCTHTLLFSVMAGVAARTGLVRGDAWGPAWAVSVSVLAVLASVPIRMVLVRIAPWMIGVRRSAVAGATA